MDLQQVRAQTEAIARAAGATIMAAYGKPATETVKSNVFDVVTETDKAAEAVILDGLRSTFPDHHIVSEESGALGAAAAEADYAWYIDPIDGTANFASSYPLFSVSIAMTDANMIPQVGVVYGPYYDEMFSAARGHGATRNGEPISVSRTDTLEKAVLISGFSPDRELAMKNLRHWVTFMLQTRGLRRQGSAALDLCAVAAGRVDGFWENHINPWDVLGGLICIEEAGGTISDYAGTMEQVYSGASVVASNGPLHAAMLDVLREETTSAAIRDLLEEIAGA